MLLYDSLPDQLRQVGAQLRTIEIEDCGEPLVEVDPSIARFDPHPYLAAGAPYGSSSPFVARQSVAEKLAAAQSLLTQRSLALKLFDLYRPVRVQQYMVDYTFRDLRYRSGLANQSDEEIWNRVYSMWAHPELDPRYPPPHSTGGAVDLTIIQADGSPLDMGSNIDEDGPVQLPDHFKEINPAVHANRCLLNDVMTEAGFVRLLHEWWHFSFGDRHWALAVGDRTGKAVKACYGRVD